MMAALIKIRPGRCMTIADMAHGGLTLVTTIAARQVLGYMCQQAHHGIRPAIIRRSLWNFVAFYHRRNNFLQWKRGRWLIAAAACILVGLAPQSVAAASKTETTDFEVQPVLPDAQANMKLNYFDLVYSKDTTHTIQMRVKIFLIRTSQSRATYETPIPKMAAVSTLHRARRILTEVWKHHLQPLQP